MKIKIDDVARLAGVSTGTISRVINGHSTVAKATRIKVLGVMEQLGYEPDPVARELSMRSKFTLGIWIGAGENRLSPYFNRFWFAVLREMQERAIQFVEVPVALEQIKRRLDAVLMFKSTDIDERLRQLTERKVPAVLIGHDPRISCVAPDDVAGGTLAAQQFIARGHTRLMLLNGNAGVQWEIDRRKGFVDTLLRHGLDTERCVVQGEASVLGGYRLMREVWSAGMRPTGVFCGTDEMAIGALGALQDLQVPVPEAVSIIGFDGLTAELCPALTSVAQNIEAISQHAVTLALEAIDGKPSRQVVVPVTLYDGKTLADAAQL
ncbi:LacI family DNA-binding transcriptional regulator [Collimonas silvisoli]|uniref:LacI family DNA-binding transcriptional regulator n=1 Tax=Collimonas silvisoli TaxID=2825884 RepID=UPI001B8C3C31|nr:LacI family DNA-binding transcriptional regulator [Collimonas silvisoli]